MPPPAPSFLAARWQGQVALGTLLWRDMLGVGTVLNLLASVGALGLAAAGAGGAWAVALHFAPVPYNLFLFLALWRRPDRPAWAAALAAVWVALMTVV